MHNIDAMCPAKTWTNPNTCSTVCVIPNFKMVHNNTDERRFEQLLISEPTLVTALSMKLLNVMLL